MFTTLTDLAATLQILFTTDAKELARSTAFVHRARQRTGPTFAQVTVFGWLQDPTASRADLAQLAAQRGTAVCPSAWDQRFTPAAGTAPRHPGGVRPAAGSGPRPGQSLAPRPPAGGPSASGR